MITTLAELKWLITDDINIIDANDELEYGNYKAFMEAYENHINEIGGEVDMETAIKICLISSQGIHVELV